MMQNRKTYLDILRIIACFLVIFNHLRGYTAYQTATNPVQSFYYMFFTMLTRINVPVFFMISGSLLLSRDVSYKDLFLKRLPRIAGALLCASAILYFLKWKYNSGSMNLVVFLRKLLRGEHETSYWYLYAYVGLLLTLPFMRRIVTNFTHAEFILLVAVRFVFVTFLPFFNYILRCFDINPVTVSSYFNVPLMTLRTFFYPLVGYYLDHVFDINKLTAKNVWTLPAVALSGILISSCFTYHQGVTSGYTQDFVQTFDYATAICVFLLAKWIFVNCPKMAGSMISRPVSLVGSLTFGIYLINPILTLVDKYFKTVITTSNPILFSVMWCVYSMCVGGCITYLLKKLPVIRKML